MNHFFVLKLKPFVFYPVIALIYLLISSCSTSYTIPEKYDFPELLEVNRYRLDVFGTLSGIYIVDQQSLVVRDGRRYYLLILRYPTNFSCTLRSQQIHRIVGGGLGFFCGPGRSIEIMRIYRFLDSLQKDEIVARLQQLSDSE